MKAYLLDTGALLSNWVQKNPEFRLFTPSSVVDEIHNRPSKQRVESLISLGQLSIEDPQEHCIIQARNAAGDTGDSTVLSNPDIDLLGLAYGMSMSGTKVVVVSTDLAVLNTARHMGVDIIDPQGKMKHEIKWIMKCPACGNSSSNTKQPDCEVCGTRMKRKPTSKKKIR